MADTLQIVLPETLTARLQAAGVTGDASLQAALAADPELRAAFEQGLQEAVLAAFAQVADGNALAALASQFPFMVEDAFLASIETAIGRAEAAGDSKAAEGLRQRLAALKQIRQAMQQSASPLAQALMAFVEAADEDGGAFCVSRERGAIAILRGAANAGGPLPQRGRSDEPPSRRPPRLVAPVCGRLARHS